MRAKKLMNDSFYSNSEDFSGVASVNSLSSDLFYHFTDDDGNTKKLSGWTGQEDGLTPSGVILEDSFTTSITVVPATPVTGVEGDTDQFVVTNQNAIDVTSECTFTAGDAKLTVNATGLLTLVTAGSSSVTIAHPDIDDTDIVVTISAPTTTTTTTA